MIPTFVITDTSVLINFSVLDRVQLLARLSSHRSCSGRKVIGGIVSVLDGGVPHSIGETMPVAMPHRHGFMATFRPVPYESVSVRWQRAAATRYPSVPPQRATPLPYCQDSRYRR